MVGLFDDAVLKINIPKTWVDLDVTILLDKSSSMYGLLCKGDLFYSTLCRCNNKIEKKKICNLKALAYYSIQNHHA